MAREFKLLSVICFVVACLGLTSTAVDPTTTTADVTSTTVGPTTTTADVTSTTVEPTTTTAGLTSTAVDPTTTTADVTSTTVGPTTTTAGVTSTTVGPTTTTADVTSTTVGPTTTTADVTSTTVEPTTTTAGVTSTTVGPTTTTAGVTSTTVGPTTTTADVTSTTVGPTTTKAGVTSTTVGPTTATADVTSTTVGPTTTKADVTSTTVGPTTTKADVTSTTVGPTTTKAVSVGPTTTRPGASTSTASATTQLPGPCAADPCHDRSTCEPRANQTFVCLCLAGDKYNYDTKRCERAQVFPGQLDLPNLDYHNNMAIKTSPEFQEASIYITNEMAAVFKDAESYSGSTVLELRELDGKVRTVGRVSATVDIIFTADSDVTTAAITEYLDNATKCANCLLANATFDGTNLCVEDPCDGKTSECKPTDGNYNCTCLEGYIETNFSDKMCIACPSGSKAEGSKNCTNCSFGYSGFNCNDQWELVLVIVGSLLGGLLLITLILLPIIARKSSKKSSKKNKNADSGKPFVSHPPAQKPLVNSSLANSQAASVHGSANGLSGFANAGVPRIPRATTTNSWDSRSNLEMTPSNSRQNLIPVGRNPRFYDDRDDMNPYAQSRPQSNPYPQTRPQTNPYAQNRPQSNPYAQGQGQSNPYYMHDDGRRFN